MSSKKNNRLFLWCTLLCNSTPKKLPNHPHPVRLGFRCNSTLHLCAVPSILQEVDEEEEVG